MGFLKFCYDTTMRLLGLKKDPYGLPVDRGRSNLRPNSAQVAPEGVDAVPRVVGTGAATPLVVEAIVAGLGDNTPPPTTTPGAKPLVQDQGRGL
jgi:hypothetical protein